MADQLQVQSVTLSFGGMVVIDSFSMAVPQGELLALIGPNGAGKTSVLNCISGVYRPGAGRILFEGRDLGRLPLHAMTGIGIARTFQHGELFGHLSVIENLLVGRHAAMRTGLLAQGLFLPRVRREEAEHRRAVEEVIAFVELERYRHQPVGGLPFGIQKLVGFARALAMQPRLLLLDEPCAGLNRQEREDLARFILRIKHQLGTTMVWVEHDMQMVADLADRLCVLDHGQYVTDGPPQAVLADARVAAIYLGSRATTAAQ